MFLCETFSFSKKKKKRERLWKIKSYSAFFSYAKSDAAGSWLAQMDRFLTLGDDKVEEKNAAKEKLIKLIDINHEALDAPKKGVTVSFVACIFCCFSC